MKHPEISKYTLVLSCALILFATLWFNVPATVRAQSTVGVEEASQMCQSKGGNSVGTTPHKPNEKPSGPGTFKCVFTVPGAICDRFIEPELQDGCYVVPSSELVGRASQEVEAILSSGALGQSVGMSGSASTSSEDLDKLLKNGINLLSAVAVMVFVVSFMIAGYQYMTARDNASQVAAAKERISTLVITFMLFVFGYGILQWLVPGGIFN